MAYGKINVGGGENVTPEVAEQVALLEELGEFLMNKGSMPPQITQDKTVTAGTSTITVSPDDGYLLSSVTVNPTPSESKTATPTTSSQTITPSTGKLLSQVTVSAISTETKTVTPTASSQTVKPSSGKFLSQVTVNGDSDLKAENIKSGVNIFGVAGSLPEGVSGIDYGTVTLTSTAESVTISHSLDATPSKGIMVYGQKNGDVEVGTNDVIRMNIWGSTYMHNTSINFSLYGAGQFSATNTSATFAAGPMEKWGTGTYTWIVFA